MPDLSESIRQIIEVSTLGVEGIRASTQHEVPAVKLQHWLRAKKDATCQTECSTQVAKEAKRTPIANETEQDNEGR